VNQRFEVGQFITFNYNPPARDVRKRPGLQTVQGLQPLERHDREKSILVLHPMWQNMMHGVDLKRLTPAETQTLKAVMDPKIKAQVDQGVWPVQGCPPYPLIRDILRRFDPTELAKNPVLFYQSLVKPFIRDKDCYRKYNPSYVFGVKVVVETHVQGTVTNPRPAFVNPNPLFKKL
jgi:hypothetical protein